MKRINWLIISSFIAPIFITYISYKPAVGATLRYAQVSDSLFVLISSLSLIIKAIKAIKSKIHGVPYPPIKFFRPTIALISAYIGMIHLNSIDEKAKSYLWQEANRIQTICSSKKMCPTTLEGWIKKDDRYYLAKIVDGTQFHIFYNSSGKEFSIYIRYWFDDFYVLAGGVTRKLIKVSSS